MTFRKDEVFSQMYLVETKADKDIGSANVAVKVRAAMAWCKQASTVITLSEYNQPQDWEYLLLSEGLFKSNQGLGFEVLIPLCRGLRDKIVSQAQGTLFIGEGINAEKNISRSRQNG
ncbi:MAG: hypothetical protein AB1633_06400 [Elusimicrobiota bacterium]